MSVVFASFDAAAAVAWVTSGAKLFVTITDALSASSAATGGGGASGAALFAVVANFGNAGEGGVGGGAGVDLPTFEGRGGGGFDGAGGGGITLPGEGGATPVAVGWRGRIGGSSSTSAARTTPSEGTVERSPSGIGSDDGGSGA